MEKEIKHTHLFLVQQRIGGGVNHSHGHTQVYARHVCCRNKRRNVAAPRKGVERGAGET